jgi:glycosyltransferase involved in cell wall biosynthesis
LNDKNTGVQPKDNRNTPRLIVNAIPLLANLTGVGHVAFEISKRLGCTAEFDTGFFTPSRTFSDFLAIGQPDPHVQMLRVAKGIFRRLPFKGFIRNLASKMTPKGSPYDLYWEPNFIPIDAISAKRIVTTVHDMSSIEHPEWHPKDRVEFFSRNFFKNIGRSDIVVAVSQFSRERFLESQSEVSVDRVRVIPCGINHDCFRVVDPEQVVAFKQHHKLPHSFVLFVGSIEPRKNLETLLVAYERLSPERREAFPLVLVGDAGWGNKEIHKRIMKLSRGVRTFGYLKNGADLALMYNTATVFVYPSLYEGFGIPPLEAMACGTPVCLSSIPVFHEIYGQDSACYADPHDPDSLASALTRLLDDELYRAQLVQKGLQLAQRYTWDHVYEQYAELFRTLLSS